MLSEIKTTYPFSVAGYNVVRSAIVKGEELRGGVAVMFAHWLWPQVFDVSKLHDQVWFKLHSVPHYHFGAVYIPPKDSPYFSHVHVAQIQEQSVSSVNNPHTLIMGDLNARMGNRIQNLVECDLDILYSNNPDPVVNANGREVLSLCKTLSLWPINHLVHGASHCEGDLTYRMKNRWISQLDWGLCSYNVMDHISDYSVKKDFDVPTNHAQLKLTLDIPFINTEILHERARTFQADQALTQQLCEKPIPLSRISLPDFQNNLPDPNSCITFSADANVVCDTVTDVLYKTCKVSMCRNSVSSSSENITNTETQRWIKLVDSADAHEIWQAIDWNGKFPVTIQNKDTPTDEEFCWYFANLLNPPSTHDLSIPHTEVYIPLLDDAITEVEVFNQIRSTHPKKAPGHDGIPPGILHFLPMAWITLLTYLMNLVFSSSFPTQWTVAKLFTIFKKGARYATENYRGISILVTLSKVYDGILNKRFSRWYKPDIEQAGALEGRSCAEQLLTLRLLIDIARYTKQTLYVTFIDYVKAYDKINRNTLLKMLAYQGCGSKFLRAIANTLMVANNMIGSSQFISTAGVRQGGASSCSLFTFYINKTITAINSFGDDRFLGSLHCLLLMDDTVLLATSRESMLKKLDLLISATDSLDMELHPHKSKFMVVNSIDKEPIVFGNTTISHTEKYVYLGNPISIAPISTQVADHLSMKSTHIRKFSTFLAKNSNAPFWVKSKVLESALCSAIFYGSESWITADLTAANRAHIGALKNMLGVRQQTNTDTVYCESGSANAKAIITRRQRNFLKNARARNDYFGSPMQMAVDLAIQTRSPMGKQLQQILNLKDDPVKIFLRELQDKVRIGGSTRLDTYITLNPQLSVHEIYQKGSRVPEYERTAFTRIRLASHYLKVETGRWSRVPRDQRLCVCRMDVQTEEHVLLHCKETDHLRNSFPNLSFNSIEAFFNNVNFGDTAKFISKVINVYSEST